MTTLIENRKARHNFHILEKFEAGIVLQGTEVKSCRAKHIQLADAYARIENGEMWLYGCHIAIYAEGNRYNHEPDRKRKLLMHRREIYRLKKAVEAKGQALVPLKIYLSRNKVKVAIGLCRGKNVADKRENLKQKEHKREAQRAMNIR